MRYEAGEFRQISYLVSIMIDNNPPLDTQKKIARPLSDGAKKKAHLIRQIFFVFFKKKKKKKNGAMPISRKQKKKKKKRGFDETIKLHCLRKDK
jgi:hypothetical protein